MKQEFKVVEYKNQTFWVSLVSWGFIKRKIYSIFKPNNRFEFPSFIPECEIAVFSEKPSSLKKPFAVIYFSSQIGVENAFAKIVSDIKRNGIRGAGDYITKIKLSDYKEFGKLFPNNI